ncbi:MAG TPA: hypothetical protein VM715_05095 [Candidatus Acidoferrum sp.]|jgi:hypothetical protein|nr:hypothetical protein [Candidatus Acidoferrum sp.]
MNSDAMSLEGITFDPSTGMVLDLRSGEYKASVETKDGTIYKLVWAGNSWYNPNTGVDEKCEPQGSGLAPVHARNSWSGHYTFHRHD